MSLRFFRRFFLLPWLSVNLSKRGASVSVGPRGAKLTAGTSGARATIGLPGTGLFYTAKLPMPVEAGRPDRVELLRDAILACLKEPRATPESYDSALAYQHQLGVQDHQLDPEFLAAIQSMRAHTADPVWRLTTTYRACLAHPQFEWWHLRSVVAYQQQLGLADDQVPPDIRDAIADGLARAAVADMKATASSPEPR